MAVLVLDKRKRPLMPCSEKRARLLLERKKAVVHRIYPFTIRLKARVGGTVQPVRIKLDPGAETTGVAVVREEATDEDRKAHVLFLTEIQHRGFLISECLKARRTLRGRRRGRKTRYRAPRFNNRCRPDGWLPPSLQHRVNTTLSWVLRLGRWVPVAELSIERVKFNMQALANPEITRVEYQRGTLFGTEIREYLLAKWGRQCAYCDAENVPLEMEHSVSRACGGSNRVSNLTLACRPCNQAKGKQPVQVFLAHDLERLERLLVQAKQPLKDAAAVNATRNALFFALLQTGLPVEAATGGRTKFNRERLGIPKTHALDAACVGNVASVLDWQQPVLAIKCTGRGSYCRTRLTAKGGIRGYLTRQKNIQGFQTGDMVKASIPNGKKAGIHTGRVAVRATGSFNIQTPQGVIQGISHRYCRLVQRGDGYGYSITSAPPSTEVEDFRAFSNLRDLVYEKDPRQDRHFRPV